MNDGPLIVQSDKTLLLEVDHEQADAARKAIAPFAELERSPEHIHTYRLTPLGLWNARAAGHDAEQVVNVLLTFSRYAVPHALLVDVAETMARYGRLRLDKHPSTAWSSPAPTARSSRRCSAPRRSPACSASGSTRRRGRRRPPQPARQPQAGAAQARLAGRGLRGLRRRRGPPDRARRVRLDAARPTSRRRPTRSGTAAPASSCSPAARARPSSARPRWRRPRRPR